MEITEIIYKNAMPVESYGHGFFRIDGQVLRGPCVITPWQARLWGGPEDHQALLDLVGQIDVVLLGTGNNIAYPPRALREALEAVGIGLEPMSSPAACRTYNVLISEGRHVALALIPLES